MTDISKDQAASYAVRGLAISARTASVLPPLMAMIYPWTVWCFFNSVSAMRDAQGQDKIIPLTAAVVSLLLSSAVRQLFGGCDCRQSRVYRQVVFSPGLSPCTRCLLNPAHRRNNCSRGSDSAESGAGIGAVHEKQDEFAIHVAPGAPLPITGLITCGAPRLKPVHQRQSSWVLSARAFCDPRQRLSQPPHRDVACALPTRP